MHFFDIWTPKSGPNPSVFCTFDLEMCFAPQWCALFWHLNFQKWSDIMLCFVHFDSGMCFAPQRRALFSTSQLLKALRGWGIFVHFDLECASRHSGVQLFISHLARWLRTRRFSEPTFRPSWATNYWNNTVNRDFPTFSRTCIFFLLSLSLLWSSHFCSSPPWLFAPLLFHLSILSEVWLPNFLRLNSMSSTRSNQPIRLDR